MRRTNNFERASRERAQQYRFAAPFRSRNLEKFSGRGVAGGVNFTDFRVCEGFGRRGVGGLRQRAAFPCGVTRILAEGESNGFYHRGPFGSGQCHAASEGAALYIGTTGRMSG